MKAIDTSVVVAAFASWHEHHPRAVEVLAEGVQLIGHCALESYSVLTRLPPPHRAPPHLVREFLRSRFSAPLLMLGDRSYKSFVLELPEHGIVGGTAYDALIAATAASHSAQLLSFDQRAIPVYQRYQVQVIPLP